MNLSISEYTPAEAAATRGVFHQAVHELAAADYTSAQLQAWAPTEYSLEQWNNQRLKAQTFVAHLGRETAGFADLVAHSSELVMGEMLIDMLYVRPSAAGQGVASSLLAQVQEAARTHRARVLVTHASETARGFFEKHGFRVITKNEVACGGETLTNYTMKKSLAAV